MTCKNENWGPHSDSYSPEDQSAFKDMLPSLYSHAAMKTTFAGEEMAELMERFEKSFGGEPLFHTPTDKKE